MFGRLILSDSVPLDQLAVVTPTQSSTWRDLRALSQSLLEVHSSLSNRRLGIPFRPTYESYAVLAALDMLEADVFLLDGQITTDEAVNLGKKFHLGAILSSESGNTTARFNVHSLPHEDRWSGSSTITILTSGSTGEPKAAKHSWQSLARPVRSNSTAVAPAWLLTYRPHLYAGLQVMLQCFEDRGMLAIPDQREDCTSTAKFMLSAGVTFVSATPSYLRRLIMFSDPGLLRKVLLKQITLGGEVVDQPILDKLKRLFPAARLVHIYATTELGRCFSVSDGLTGFPVDYLKTPRPDGVELRVQDRELLIKSPNAMRGYDRRAEQNTFGPDWCSTGDLVEIRGERVHFVGRKTDMINVAGSKVYPIEVEQVIRRIPGVSDVRVFGKKSSIAGELVACEIVPDDGQDPAQLKESIAVACRLHLTTYQQPRSVSLVSRMQLSSAGKIIRSKI